MKKYLSFPVYSVFLISILFSSCTGPSKEIFKYVPETALAVFTVHPGYLIEKGRLQELDFVKEGASETEITKKIIEDPESSGIDMDLYSTFFVYGDDPTYGCIVMPLESKTDFEEMITELEHELEESFPRDEHNGYQVISIDEAVMLYDNSIALTLFSMDEWGNENLIPLAANLLSLEREEGLLSDKDFNNFIAKQKDINAWFSSTNLRVIPGADEMGDVMDLFGSLKNNYGHVFMEFEKGSMTLTTNLRFNQSMQETIDKFNFLDEDAIKELLTYLPSKDLFFAGNTNLDPEKIFDLLKLINRDFDRTFDRMATEMDLTGDEIKKAFSGEFAISFNDRMEFEEEIDEEEFFEKIPIFVAATRMRNKTLFEKFLNMAENEAEVLDLGGYYAVNNRGIPVYIMLNDNDVIVSNKEELLKEISTDGELADNVTTSDYGSVLTKNPICFYVNLDESSFNENLDNMLPEKMDNDIVWGMEKFGKQLKSLSFSANLEEWEVRMELQNDDEYSLYTLLSQIDK
jgi:hypothetical protein